MACPSGAEILQPGGSEQVDEPAVRDLLPGPLPHSGMVGSQALLSGQRHPMSMATGCTALPLKGG